MKTALTVSALLACLALSATAEKYRDPSAVVLQRSNLNVDARTVSCIPVIGHVPVTTIQYTFTLDAECCDWFVSLCGQDHVDTYITLSDGVSVNYTDDDSRCSYSCEYGPSAIGTSYGDGCLPAGTYVLDIYLYWSYDSNCDYDFSSARDYTFCYDFCDGGAASADDQPVSFELGDAFPNPFNPSTTINFTLAETADASLKVFNVAGAEVASLVNGITGAGEHSVVFDASNLTSGVYFYTLEVAGLVETRKMVLAK